MVQSKAKTVQEYLAGLPADRREAIAAVRKVILENLPPGYEETMNWGMICYEIPLRRYPDTYNGQPLGCAALASQKQYMAVYLMSVYGDPKAAAAFKAAYKKAGKKLDMGKSCVRFKKLEDLCLEAVARAIASTPVEKLIAAAEKARSKKR